MELTGSDRRALRALGNALKPVVMIGKEGVNPKVLQALDDAHRTAELLKVRVLESSPLARQEAADALAVHSASQVVQILGHTILLYRRHPEHPRIALPSLPLPLLLLLGLAGFFGQALIAAAQAPPPSPSTGKTYVVGNPGGQAILPPELPWSGASKRYLVDPGDPWATPFERDGLDHTPRYEETVAWLRRLAEAAPEIELVSLGKSGEGREIWMVVASAEGAFTPEAIRRSDRATVLAQAGIHAGEIDGKDAGMMLLRDMTVRGTRRALLGGANFLFIPILNVDGHERFSALTRLNQRGPVGAGWRTNARNLNLNRDYGKLDTPEVRAVVRALGAWDPDLYIDLHVTDGADYQYDVTWGYNGPHAYSPNSAAWMDRFLTPELTRSLRAEGHVPGPLVFAVEDRPDLSLGIKSLTSGPRFANGYGDARHLASVLVEMHSLKPYVQRVLGAYLFLDGALRVAGTHGRELTRAVTEDRALRRRELPLAWKTPEGDTTRVNFLGVRSRFEPSAVSGGLKLVWTGKPLVQNLPHLSETVPGQSVTRPRAYWIPPLWPEITERLALHGLLWERIEEPREVEVTMYRIADATLAATPYEGHARVSGTPVAERRRERFPAGSVRVSTDQPGGDLAMLLLEPGSPDGFFQWGFFLECVTRVEYAEPYVMEPMAEEMLRGNPDLAREFQEKLLTDPKFAGDPAARLDWFYRQTPYFDDRWGLYPVARED